MAGDVSPVAIFKILLILTVWLSGRKNPTGPGIYSFKCRRAENLFNLLQVVHWIFMTLSESTYDQSWESDTKSYHIICNGITFCIGRHVFAAKFQVQSLLMWYNSYYLNVQLMWYNLYHLNAPSTLCSSWKKFDSIHIAKVGRNIVSNFFLHKRAR